MRFDKQIQLFVLEDVQDGLGGHMESERLICFRYANVEELSLETERIHNIRATELTVDKHYTVHLADVTKAIKITGATLLNGRKK